MTTRAISIEEYDLERRKCEDEGRNIDGSFLIIKRNGSQDVIYKLDEEAEEEDEEDILTRRLEIEKVRKEREDARKESARIEKIGEYARIRKESAERRKSSRLMRGSSRKVETAVEKEKRERIKLKSSKEYQSSDDEIMSYIKIYIGRRPENFDIDSIEDKKILNMIRNATRGGYETDKEIFDFITRKRRSTKPQIEFAPAVKRMILKLEDEFDRRYDKGEKLVLEIPVESFLLEMGQGKKTYLDLGYSRVLTSIKKTFLCEGINIRYTTRKVGNNSNDIEQYFTFWALTEEEARKIEEQDNKSKRQKTCRKMAKKVCKNKIHNEDNNSIWKDTEFIKNISGCSFDVDKVEESVKKGKEILFNDRIMDGFVLLFE